MSEHAMLPLFVPGDCIDRYELVYPIAQGGMGSVWAARLRSMSSFERLFAIKVMLPQFAHDRALRAMLLDEGRVAAGILHPNVAQVLDVGEHAGNVYLVMEWIDGDSIRAIHRIISREGEQIPLGVVLRVAADACAGLHAAHELRDRSGELLEVVHRDVSPQNILVTVSGAVKLIDFGVVKARGRAQEETSIGSIKGKLRYMAPEQARGLFIDRRADVWGMGAVLHYLLTGEPPYREANDAAVVDALLSGKARKPLPASVPPAVRAIVDRALALDVEKRLSSCLAMKEALEEAADALGVKATTGAVEEFYVTHMADSIHVRRASLARGIEAVEQRTFVRNMISTVDASEAITRTGTDPDVTVLENVLSVPRPAPRTRAWPLRAAASGLVVVALTAIAWRGLPSGEAPGAGAAELAASSAASVAVTPDATGTAPPAAPAALSAGASAPPARPVAGAPATHPIRAPRPSSAPARRPAAAVKPRPVDPELTVLDSRK
jgi:serine/threonine-protein kinase